MIIINFIILFVPFCCVYLASIRILNSLVYW